MAKKRAVTGFKGLVLAPITENTLSSYKTEVGEGLPYVGSMSRTAKESSQDLYYDDELYAQIKDVTGEEVEIRFGEVSLERMAELGLGEWDETTQTLEGQFNAAGKEYALGFVTDTVDHLPYYFRYRLFEMTNIKFDNFNTKKDSPAVAEVIMTGVFKKPQMASLAPWAAMSLNDDKTNEAACLAFLTAAETKPEDTTPAP